MDESQPEDESQSEDASARRIPNIDPVADDGEGSPRVSKHLTPNSLSRKRPNRSYVPQQVIREVGSDAKSQLHDEDQSESQEALDQEPMVGERTNPPSITSEEIRNEEDDSRVGGDLQDELSPSRPSALSLEQNVPQEAVGQTTVTVFGASSRFGPTLNDEGLPSSPSKFSPIDTDSSSKNADAINATDVSSTGVSSQKLRDRTAIQSCEGVSPVHSGVKEDLMPSAGVNHVQTESISSSDRKDAMMLSMEDNKPPVFGRSTSAAAASIVASFLKPSATTSSYTPPAMKKRKLDPRSPPTTPVSLAHLVSGVPTSVEGTEKSSGRGHQRVSPDGVMASRRSAPGVRASPGLLQSSATTPATCPSPRSPIGGSRFLHQEWPLRARERRRILNFPKRSEPVRAIMGSKFHTSFSPKSKDSSSCRNP